MKQHKIFSPKDQEVLEFLGRELAYAEAAFESAFQMHYGNKEWESSYKAAPGFFAISRRSLFNDALMILKKVASKWFLLKTKYDICCETGENIGKAFAELTSYRDKYLAHYDDELFSDHSNISMPIEGARLLILHYKRVLRQIDPNITTTYTNRTDVIRLLDKLLM